MKKPKKTFEELTVEYQSAIKAYHAACAAEDAAGVEKLQQASQDAFDKLDAIEKAIVKVARGRLRIDYEKPDEDEDED